MGRVFYRFKPAVLFEKHDRRGDKKGTGRRERETIQRGQRQNRSYKEAIGNRRGKIRCPVCGKEFKPVDYNREQGIWKCDRCGTVLRECPFCKSPYSIFVGCNKYEDTFYCQVCNRNYTIPKKGYEEE